MEKQVLSICIPTYNRKDVLVAEVKDYLSVKDDRFKVVVQDNCSTDGTSEDISVIQDGRLIYRKNESNEGSIPNWIKSLSGNDTEYLLFTLDKDLVDIRKLTDFINYLEQEKPAFGYVDLSNNKPYHIQHNSRGIDSIRKVAYLSKHPSGYFWKRELFEYEIEQPYFKVIRPKFDFPFEVINAHISVQNDSVIVYMPLIINANMRKLQGKTLSYDESNIYFSCKKRLEEFQLYLSDAYSLDLPLSEKKIVAKVLFKKVLGQVTMRLRMAMRHKANCEHYNLTPRIVSVPEMLGNIWKAQRLFRKISKGNLAPFSIVLTASSCTLRACLSIIKNMLKECIIPYKDYEIKA